MKARESVKKENTSPNAKKVIKDEDKSKTPSKSSVRKTVSFAGDGGEARPSKRMKIDHDE